MGGLRLQDNPRHTKDSFKALAVSRLGSVIKGCYLDDRSDLAIDVFGAGSTHTLGCYFVEKLVVVIMSKKF